MITKIELNNFQSHKDTELNFVPGLNVITGQSDSGKTAILRGLYWLSYNKPAGESFKNNKMKSDEVCSITVGLDSKEIPNLIRVKGKKTNSYYLHIERQEHLEEFKAFGADVPEEITKALNFNEINIQKQMDAPFLLSDTPGEIAKFLNKITNLDIIDKCLFNLASYKRTATANLKSIDTELTMTEKEISELDYLNEAEKMLSQIESKNNSLEKLEEKISGLSELVEKIEEQQELLSDFKDLSGAEQIIDGLIIKMKEQEEILKKYNGLLDLSQDIERIQGKIMALRYSIETDEKELHANIKVCPLCGRSE